MKWKSHEIVGSYGRFWVQNDDDRTGFSENRHFSCIKKFKPRLISGSLDRLLEEERWEEAAGLLEFYLNPEREISGHKRNVAQAELVFLECILKQRPDRLQSLLSEEHRKFITLAQKSSPSIFRTQYCCFLFVDKNEDKASQHRSQFDQMFKHYPYSLIVEEARKEMDLALSVFRKGKEYPV